MIRSSGVAGIVFGTLAVSVVTTQVTGTMSHWPLVLAGLAVGLYTASALGRR